MTIDEQRQAIREGLAKAHFRHDAQFNSYAGVPWEHIPDSYEGKIHAYKYADSTLAFLTEKARNIAAERLVDVYGLDPFQAMEYAGVMCDAIFGTAPLIEPGKPLPGEAKCPGHSG